MSLERRSIWLDCDTGHDDAFAILLAAFHERSELLGISTVHGNASLRHTTYNTRAVLKAIGRSDVQVFRGAAAPLSRKPCYASDIHGETGLDGVTLLPSVQPEVNSELPTDLGDVAEFLLAQPAQTVWLVATGPLTNVAQLLSSHPHLTDHLAGVSIMGGAIGGQYTDAPLGTVEGIGERFGNWTPYAEFNIYADPEAAHFVLSNYKLARKMTLIPLDVTHQCRGNEEAQNILFGPQHGDLSLIRRLMREILMFFSGTYRTQFGIMDGPPLHDPVAVFAVLCPEAFTDNAGEKWHAEVIANVDSFDIKIDPFNRVGQTIIRPAIRDGMRVPRGLDIPSFWRAIDAALAKSEQGR